VIDACSLGFALVIGGLVVVFALRLFVDWPFFPKITFMEDVYRRLERAGRMPPPIWAVGMLAMIGGLLFLAIDGC